MTNGLFTPLTLRETTLSNRVMVSPMCQYSCDARDGVATDWHFVHLGSRAMGGAGIVMTEAAAVEPRGRIAPQDLGIWDSEHVEALAPITSFIRDQGSQPAIQLAHAGRKASKSRPWEGSTPLKNEEGGWEVIAPSSVPWPYDDVDAPPTRAMTQDDIETVIDSFTTAAENALAAGFEICEIHAAHGYLLHEFLSPITNQRTDDYGGSFENRSRLVREVTAAVRSVWPDDRPVFVRISATDWLPERDAWTLDQSVRLADHFAGADLIDVSAGGIHPDQQLPESGPGYQIPYAKQIGAETTENIAVGAVGGITAPEHADALIRTGQADLAIVGREHLRDPHFTMNAASKLGDDRITVPPQYRRGYPEITSE